MFDVRVVFLICWFLELLVRVHAVYNIRNIVCQRRNMFHVTEIIFTKHESNTTY